MSADVIPIRPPLPDPHPASVPAVDAITRLIERTSNEHDRGVLEAALYAVQTAYPAVRRSTLPRDEPHDPGDTAWSRHDDPRAP